MQNRSVVIGVSAIKQKGNFEDLDEALILMDKAVKKAINDSGNVSIKDHIDEIRINLPPPLLIITGRISFII